MKVIEIIDEARKKKKRKRRVKGAAYGPGPFGMYGTNAGYSGGDGGAVGEAAYPGNIGAMEIAEFFKKATPQQKVLLKKFIAEKNLKSAWALIQKITGVNLVGQEFHEGISSDLSIKSIIATADSITKTYGDLKTMAEKWVYNNGTLNGFHRNAAGVGKRWYDTFFWNKMEDDLRTLVQKNPKAAGVLRDFFNIERDDRGHISFTKISKNLPKALYQVGEKIGNDDLKKFSRGWALKQKDYEDYLGRVEAEVNDDEDDYTPAPKQPKDNIVGRQNAAAEEMVNQILKTLDRRVAGEIRNTIAREPNKLQALQRELAKRNIKIGESIQEGWRDTLAGLALGAGVAMGGPAAANIEKVVVNKGDTVYSIAKAFDTTPQTIQKLNKLDKKFTIKPGQTIKVPKWDEIAEPEKKKTVAKTPTKTKTLTGSPYEALLTNAARAGGITDPIELAAFLAQSLVETGQFKDLDEKGSRRRIERLYDPKYNPKGAEEIGNTKIGDGWRYRGRGFLQLTGRYNYTAASRALGLNLVKNPDLALKPEIAAKTAVWYWKWRVRPNVSNFNNTTKITELVQGGRHQLERRKMIFADFKKFNLEQT